MTLKELSYFVALADERNIRRAALRCRVKPSTLRASVRRFESGLGVSLFEWVGAECRLTDLGRALYDRAARALFHQRQIETLSKASTRPEMQSLSLGAEPELAPYYFPALMPFWRERRRGASLNLEQAPTEQLKARLALGQLDVLLVSLPFAASDIVTRVLFDEPLMVLMGAGHPLSAQVTLTADSLYGQTVILPNAETRLYRETLDVCPALRASLDQGWVKTTPSGTGLDTLRHMVAVGLGVAVIPLSAVTGLAGLPDTLVTRPFADPAIARRVALVWRASFPGHGAIDALISVLDVLNPSYRLDAVPNTVSSGVMVDNTRW